MSTPLVSVIIPAYNAEKFIAETLDSVFAQTYRPIEVIVVDDGSTDRTAEIVQNYQTSKTNKTNETNKTHLIYMHQQNSGPSKARNTGIKAAKGEYIAFLDADDLWLPEKIESQVAMMVKYPEVGMLCGNMVDFDENGQKGTSHFEKHNRSELYFGDPIFVIDPFRKILSKNFVSTPTVIVRRSVLEQVGLFDLDFRFSEDYLLWLRFAKATKVAYQTDVMTLRRKHAFNLTNDVGMHVFVRPRVLRKIEEEHGDILRKNAIDLSPRYSHTYFMLGYYRLFRMGESDVASTFLKSFRYRPTLRAAIYWALTAAGLGKAMARLRKIVRGDLSL